MLGRVTSSDESACSVNARNCSWAPYGMHAALQHPHVRIQARPHQQPTGAIPMNTKSNASTGSNASLYAPIPSERPGVTMSFRAFADHATMIQIGRAHV